jgi:tRNA(Ile)-lysidine synthase
MRAVRAYDDRLTLWRPLLHVRHEDLLAYCREHGVPWVEDPTNHNPDYTRTRFRALAGMLRDEGLSVKRMATTSARLARAQDALDQLTIRLNATAKIDGDDWQFVYDLNKLKSEPFELGVRLLRDAIAQVGGADARFDKVETVAQACLLNDADVTATLGHCLIQTDRRRGVLRIRREAA